MVLTCNFLHQTMQFSAPNHAIFCTKTLPGGAPGGALRTRKARGHTRALGEFPPRSIRVRRRVIARGRSTPTGRAESPRPARGDGASTSTRRGVSIGGVVEARTIRRRVISLFGGELLHLHHHPNGVRGERVPAHTIGLALGAEHLEGLGGPGSDGTERGRGLPLRACACSAEEAA